MERAFHRTEHPKDLGDLGDPVRGLEGLYGGADEPGWEELGFTNAWHDDGGGADYLLECLLADDTSTPT